MEAPEEKGERPEGRHNFVHALDIRSRQKTSWHSTAFSNPEVMTRPKRPATTTPWTTRRSTASRAGFADSHSSRKNPRRAVVVKLRCPRFGNRHCPHPIELCSRWRDCRVMAADAAGACWSCPLQHRSRWPDSRIELAQVDAKRLPFKDGLFDIVMSNSIVHHIPEPEHVLREAVRVTRLGGMLFFRDLMRPETDEQLAQLVTTYTGNESPRQQKMFAESLHAARPLTEIRQLIGALGFPEDTVQQTSDRHWTWSARRE